MPPRNRNPNSSSKICCVPQCTNYQVKGGMSFFHFPRDHEWCDKWKIVLKMGKQPSPHQVVCAKHFVPIDFFPGPLGMKKKTLLKKNAVPSQNLPVGRHDQQPPELCVQRGVPSIRHHLKKNAIPNQNLPVLPIRVKSPKNRCSLQIVPGFQQHECLDEDEGGNSLEGVPTQKRSLKVYAVPNQNLPALPVKNPREGGIHESISDGTSDLLACSAPFCGSTEEDHHLFEFPAKKPLRLKWLEKSGLEQQEDDDDPLFLCELHFTFDQFRSNSKVLAGCIAPLKITAIPTIFTQIQRSPNSRYSPIDLIETSATPTIETLHRLIHIDGVFEDLYELLQCKVEKLDPLDRLCTISFDEKKFSAAKDLANSKQDLIIDIFTDHDTEDYDNCITVVLVRGLRTGWEQLIACRLTASYAEVKSQITLLEKSISFAESCGLRVLSISSNLTTKSRLMWSAMGIDVTESETERITHYIFNDHKIHVVPDACHLLKSLMAAVHLGINLSPSLVDDEALPSTHVSSEYVKQLWESEVKVRTGKRMLAHLKKHYVEQDSSDAITLESAVQFFSVKTAKALERAVVSKCINPDALTTAYFCRLVNQWFSICDSKVPEHGITVENKQTTFDFLARVIEVFQGIRIDGCWSPLNAGMIMCTTSLCGVVSILLLQDGIDVVLLHRFSQDAVENIISLMFKKAGSTPEVFSKHCLESLKTITLQQLKFEVEKPSNPISSTTPKVGEGSKTSKAVVTSRKRKPKDLKPSVTSGGSKRSSLSRRVGRPKKASNTSKTSNWKKQEVSPKPKPQKRKRKNTSSSSGTPKIRIKKPIGRPKKTSKRGSSNTTEPESRKRKIPSGTSKQGTVKRSKK